MGVLTELCLFERKVTFQKLLKHLGKREQLDLKSTLMETILFTFETCLVLRNIQIPGGLCHIKVLLQS